jgi:hypothetical protein
MSEPAKPPDGWTFESDEVSPGHYRVVGRDAFGHEVERHANQADLDVVLREAWAAAKWVEGQSSAGDIRQR